MKKVCIGIDVSKDTLDYCVINFVDHSILEQGQFENSRKGINHFLRKWKNPSSICMEHTGYYGSLLVSILDNKQHIYYVLNPLELKLSQGMVRGKTDKVDAFRIAIYGVTNKHKLKPYKLSSMELQQLKALMTSREGFVKISVQLKNSIKANQILSKTINLKVLIKEQKRQIAHIEKSIKTLEEQMNHIITTCEHLKKCYDKITKVIGVGPITAIKCIVETENFLKFNDARKFNCHSGLAPFPYQSGSSIKGRTRTSKLRDKSLKAILYKAAGSAIQHDPQLRKYYLRKRKEGKHKLTVINAVANKIVLRIFAVANRNEPFVKLTA